MRIVKGRGKNRSSFDLPCGEIVRAASTKDQQAAVAVLCDLAGIK